MRVCHVTSAHNWSDTRIYTRMFCGLQNGGVEVTLVAPNCPHINEPKDGTALLKPPKNRLLRLLLFRKKIVNKSIELKPEIVHLHDPELFTYTEFFKKQNIAVVLDWHEDFVGQIKIKHWIPKFLRGLISKIVYLWCKQVTQKADASITVTPDVVNKMKYANPVLIRNFPTLRELPATIPPYTNRLNLIYLGALTPNRGCDEMAKSISLLRDSEQVVWDIVGEISEGAVKSTILNHAKPATVNFLGFLNRDEVASCLAEAKIGLCTIKDIDNYGVSYPTKVFEYMMWGIPVVMSRFSSLVELFGKEVPGIFVNPDNTEEIRDAIQWLLDNPKEAEKMGLLGRKLIKERFNWERDLHNLINLYENIHNG